jgi:hypothetical protein
MTAAACLWTEQDESSKFRSKTCPILFLATELQEVSMEFLAAFGLKRRKVSPNLHHSFAMNDLRPLHEPVS